MNAKKINLTSIILTTKSSEDQTFWGDLFFGRDDTRIVQYDV